MPVISFTADIAQSVTNIIFGASGSVNRSVAKGNAAHNWGIKYALYFLYLWKKGKVVWSAYDFNNAYLCGTYYMDWVHGCALNDDDLKKPFDKMVALMYNWGPRIYMGIENINSFANAQLIDNVYYWDNRAAPNTQVPYVGAGFLRYKPEGGAIVDFWTWEDFDITAIGRVIHKNQIGIDTGIDAQTGVINVSIHPIVDGATQDNLDVTGEDVPPIDNIVESDVGQNPFNNIIMDFINDMFTFFKNLFSGVK